MWDKLTRSTAREFMTKVGQACSRPKNRRFEAYGLVGTIGIMIELQQVH
jgi:hypothetical protein